MPEAAPSRPGVAPDEPRLWEMFRGEVRTGGAERLAAPLFCDRAVCWPLAAIVGSVGAYLFVLAGDLSTTGPRVGAEKKKEDELDQKETPFTAGITYDGAPGANWKVVLDRALSMPEQDELALVRHPEASSTTEYGSVLSYLKSLGGRVLGYPQVLDNEPGIRGRRAER